MKKIFFIIFLLLFGCIHSQRPTRLSYIPKRVYYVKKEFIPLGCSYCLSVPNRINKNEYRLLQLPIQECYKLEK